MYQVFCCAKVFNQTLSKWDVSNVTTMKEMFENAETFNNGGSNGINDWDVSNVITMEKMFMNTKFDQPIDKWVVSSVINMYRLFSGVNITGLLNASYNPFNQNISGWDISSVTNMDKLFFKNNKFNQNLSDWGNRFNSNVSTNDMFFMATNMKTTFSNLSPFVNTNNSSPITNPSATWKGYF
tara:strand:- start:7081 stop:7626 length:546 start_codon:yes stop_codon:yes gene_type:complete